MFCRSQFVLLFIFLLAIVLSGLCECAIILVRLVCTPPLLFCSIALDASKQKNIVHMVRILMAWLVERGRFREFWVIIGVGQNESNEQGGWLVFKILTERTPSLDFPLKSCILGQVGTVPVKDSLNFCWCHCFNSRLMVVFIHY